LKNKARGKACSNPRPPQRMVAPSFASSSEEWETTNPRSALFFGKQSPRRSRAQTLVHRKEWLPHPSLFSSEGWETTNPRSALFFGKQSPRRSRAQTLVHRKEWLPHPSLLPAKGGKPRIPAPPSFSENKVRGEAAPKTEARRQSPIPRSLHPCKNHHKPTSHYKSTPR
jgi:hypothetical protein